MTNIRRRLDLKVSNDLMELVMSCQWPKEEHDLLESAIMDECKTLKIPDPPTSEDLNKLFKTVEGPELKFDKIVLRKGTPSIDPVNGKVEWTKDFFSTEFIKDSLTGALDYRQRKEKQSVMPDQLLARVFPAREGKPGHNIFGKPTRISKANRAVFKTGVNIRREDEDEGVGAYYSKVDGRIEWTGTTLSVNEIYVIGGNVDYKSGDIVHPGSVSISGDVLAGFAVNAKGDVEIKGMIEAAQINAGGSIVVRGGIASSPDRKIVAGGMIQAQFVENAYLEAGGDINVRNEIVNSTIHTLGAFVMPGGRVTLGTIMALGGIEVGRAGTPAQTPCTLIAAENFHHCLEIEEKREGLDAARKRLKVLHTKLAALAGSNQPESQDKRDNIETGQLEIEGAENKIERLQKEIEELIESSESRMKEEIVIQSMIYPETTLRIRGVTKTILDEMKGPLRVTLVDGEITFLKI